MIEIIDFIFGTLVFPGLLFASFIGLLYLGIDRKVTGRLQNRIGPPVWQEFIDFGKLMCKEDITPASAHRHLFTAAPLLALGASVAALLLIPVNSGRPVLTTSADLLILLYLMNLPAIFLMLGGYSSGGPFGTLGSTRHIVQLMGYELVFILTIAAVAARAGTLGLAGIVGYQAEHGWLILDWRMIPAAIAMLVAVQGKLLRVPFDIPEAETEIVSGPLTEYSGPKLAIWRLSYGVEMIAVVGLVVSVLLGGPVAYSLGSITFPPLVDFLVKTFLIVMLTTLARNIMARLRIDQTLKFYWTVPTVLAALSLALVMVVP
ncbi:MAG: complex I subunit 1 family protein [Candidatus Hadarchaeales archaeon]